MFPKVGDTTGAEVTVAEKTYALVELDCGYTAVLPGRGYIEGETLQVKIVSIEPSHRSQPSIQVEAA